MFEKYKNYQYLDFDELNICVNYICSCLNSGGTNYPYFYDMYCYYIKNIYRNEMEKEKRF